MSKYIIKSKQLKSGWWEPLYECSDDYFEPLGYGDLQFKTKEKADQYILDELKDFDIYEEDNNKIIIQ